MLARNQPEIEIRNVIRTFRVLLTNLVQSGQGQVAVVTCLPENLHAARQRLTTFNVYVLALKEGRTESTLALRILSFTTSDLNHVCRI